jgi:hypothetical protein
MTFFFSWYDDVCLNSHVTQCLGLDMIRLYCLLIVTFRVILVGKSVLAFFVGVL